MATLRLFLAVPVPAIVEKGVGDILAKISHFREVRWVSKDQIHITLRFLGNTEEKIIPELETLLRRATSGFSPFETEIEGLGAFPNLEHPRVLFMPLTQGEGPFRQLEGKISSDLSGIGFKPEEREYHPHLTLGRVKEKGNPQAAIRLLQELFPAQWGGWKVDRVILFKSQLTSNGSIYTKLGEFELGKA